MSSATAGDDTLLERFAPLFDGIREGAVRRELERALPRDEVRALADAGFGALRLPVADGGSGASIPQLTRLVSALAAADSNVAHVWRGHFGFVELLLLRPDSAERRAWFERIAGGAIVGNATSEQTGNTLADMQSTVAETSGRWLLNGTKFYSTGTLYSDWVYSAAGRADAAGGVERVTFAVRTDAPGVTVVDDWDGFGQKHTASGTTRFVDVEVDPATISSYRDAPLSHIQAFYQLYLVAVVTGIAAAVEQDTVEFVRPRTRTYIHANTARPGDDPQVLEVIGRLSAAAFACGAVTQAAAALLASAAATNVPGEGVERSRLDAAENAVYQAQVHVLDSTLEAATRMFEVGGASATYRERALDRHWRNARVVASHNPAIYKYRTVGAYALDGRGPVDVWDAYGTVGRTEFRA